MGRSIRAKLLNGERLVADDITSNHYRGIDRKIPMEKVVEWPASVTCRRLVMMQQSYNANVGNAIQCHTMLGNVLQCQQHLFAQLKHLRNHLPRKHAELDKLSSLRCCGGW